MVKHNRRGKGKHVEPASAASSHAVAAEKGRAAAENEEQQEDNFRRVHVEGVPPGGRDVDHGVEGREEDLRGVDVAPGAVAAATDCRQISRCKRSVAGET